MSAEAYAAAAASGAAAVATANDVEINELNDIIKPMPMKKGKTHVIFFVNNKKNMTLLFFC
jgi:hypothetical protein